MVLHDDAISSVEKMEDGPQIGAFFDFDGTVVSGFSAVVFLREQLLQGQLSRTDIIELAAAMANLALGRIGFSGAMAVSAGILRGVSEQSYYRFGEQVYEKHIARLVYPESRALVAAHLRKGHTVAIISSATPYQIEPAARDLGIEHVLCTRLVTKKGLFAGAVVKPVCWGKGKVIAAAKFAAKQRVDLDRSVFYTDSHEDLDLLEKVGFPRVINPSAKLEQIAQQRGWPIQRFSSRGSSAASLFARSLGVYASLVASAALGLGVWWLSGSKSEGRNITVSLFADLACALIGLKIKISGEENIWANRPAVVIVNHQSKADALIVLKLLRGNFAAIGKKEIASIPLVGQAIQFAGVIPIDREDPKKAIESMKPLLDAVHREGRFVVVAPEGTRSTSTKPGPFKKGAFHVALQAKIPILPIVIHNAIDVQPKGEFVFRPATVKVEVLKAVDTSNWTVNTLDTHVAEVRNLYLRALGYPEEALPVPAAAKARAKSGSKTTSKRRRKRPLKRTSSAAIAVELVAPTRPQ
jgi:putative phosphoserine phosphatase / 1-acylglycerol-3-phosphate O-acyltransferase